MTYSTKIKWFIGGILMTAILGRTGCFYAKKYYDTYRRPWAYARHAGQPLLVGRWQGSCIDPDQVTHRIDLEIYHPTTDEQRWRRLSGRRIKRDRSSPTFFDGAAILSTGSRRDSCELWGGLDKADGHEVHFQLRPVHDKHPPGFHPNLLKGTWQGDEIDLTVEFAWFREDGSSFSDSADPRYSTPGKLLLQRVK